MAIHVTEQLRTFLLSILLGLGAGVLYDLLRACLLYTSPSPRDRG